MERWWKHILSLALAAILAACSRGPKDNGSTSITISSPSRLLASIPSGRTACFGINVTGASISPAPAPGNSCSPPMGLIAGFAPSGQDISLSVPASSSVNLALYLYLLPASAPVNAPCPTLAANFLPAMLQNTYMIGSASNVQTGSAGSSTTVDISVNFPSSGQTIAQQLSMPASCSQSSSGPVETPGPFSISAGAGAVTGSNIVLIGQAGVYQGTSGTGIKLIVH